MDDDYPTIKDFISGQYYKIYDTKQLRVTYESFDKVEVYDEFNRRTYKFKTGDARMAGIKVPDGISSFDYANKRDEFQHGVIDECAQEDSEKLT